MYRSHRQISRQHNSLFLRVSSQRSAALHVSTLPGTRGSSKKARNTTRKLQQVPRVIEARKRHIRGIHLDLEIQPSAPVNTPWLTKTPTRPSIAAGTSTHFLLHPNAQATRWPHLRPSHETPTHHPSHHHSPHPRPILRQSRPYIYDYECNIIGNMVEPQTNDSIDSQPPKVYSDYSKSGERY